VDCTGQLRGSEALNHAQSILGALSLWLGGLLSNPRSRAGRPHTNRQVAVALRC